MSKKRQATNELHPENWDREDDPEPCGTFRMAPEDELKGRVIKRARRKLDPVEKYDDTGILAGKKPTLNAENNGSEVTSTGSSTLNSKSLFGNFQGFTKTNSTGTSSLSTPGAASPFKFLSSLAAKSANSEGGSLASTPTTPATTTPSLGFKFTPDTSSSRSFFSTSKNESDNEKLSSGKSIMPKMMSLADGINSTSSSSPITSLALMSKTVTFSMTTNAPTSTSINKDSDKYMKLNHSTSTSATATFSTTTSPSYYSKLKSLNQSVSDWIKQHVDKNPLCILTPIFNDYEKYLKEIEKEKEEDSQKTINETKPSATTSLSQTKTPSGDCLFKVPLNTNNSSATNNQNTPSKSNVDIKTNGFSFGLKKSDNVSTTSGDTSPTSLSSPQSSSIAITSQPSTGFTFGIKPATANTSGGFSFLSNFAQSPGSDESKKTLNPTGFRFGNVAPSTSNTNNDVVVIDDDDNEDQPPKAEFKQVVEEDAVFSNKCKVFVKKEDNFVDKGVGTLYLKPVEDSGKTQLLVRADTNLGNILLNFILNDGIPTKRTGKNNVMMVCVPTPDVQKATAVLLRVKTSEEADELLKVIDEHKK